MKEFCVERFSVRSFCVSKDCRLEVFHFEVPVGVLPDGGFPSGGFRLEDFHLQVFLPLVILLGFSRSTALIQCIGIVTGGAGTLALVNARALLEHGLSGLALFDLDLSHACTQISELRKDFPNAQILEVQVDVSDVAAVEQAVDLAVKELGSVDILCCFAGVVGCTHAIDMTPKEWRRMLDINTTGAFLCAQAVAKWVPPIKD